MLNKFCSQYEFAFAKSSLSTQSRGGQHKVVLGKYVEREKMGKKAREKEPSETIYHRVSGFRACKHRKKGFICSKVSTSFECFVSAVAGKKRRKGRKKIEINSTL
jgi:hypothetical protein